MDEKQYVVGRQPAQRQHFRGEKISPRVYGPDGKQITFPKPNGMSGSPVWLIYDDEGPNDPVHTPVVGILIEHCPSKLALVATDIGFAVDMIRSRAATPD